MESDYEEKSIRVVRGIILKYFANNDNLIFFCHGTVSAVRVEQANILIPWAIMLIQKPIELFFKRTPRLIPTLYIVPFSLDIRILYQDIFLIKISCIVSSLG